MPLLAAAQTANASHTFPSKPVAVFLGGTSGIGQAMAEALARYTKGDVHIVLCGRNRTAAESIIASFPKSTSSGAEAQHEFAQCDATLMSNIDTTTSALISRLPKVNYLVLSSGFLSMSGRDDTSEGIDKRMALHYYGRWKFIHDLLPLLQKASDAGEDAKVMTVLGAGNGGKIDLDDLALRKNYSAARAGSASPTYSDLMTEVFAEKEPGISFVHAYPGVVRTPLLNCVIKTLVYPISVSPEQCAEHMLYALLAGSAGASRRDNKGDDIGKKNYWGTEEARKRLWDHTADEISRAVNRMSSSFTL
ncbi:NAD(P)-binding protein [Wolfiporia cocos MD-104 SS10]|uniref:NAD(P)-binding protein n=1 Tax=Wolfiporia cocos (strain MD-104) TaxID=742152 RepID=A0A2H3JN41_WOLCO|nr:NAD(P)-binding protein [Wolfiporia cocos MD-104 SS10]